MNSKARKMGTLHATRILYVIAIAVLAPVHASAVESPRDGLFVPPGRLIDVNGITMHIYCIDHGAPTVVLDAGIGRFSLEWRAVQEQVARYTRVCAYDRAGYGWSDYGGHTRTVAEIACMLHALLDAAGEHGPYLMAGHSFGGFNVRYFTERYADEVAGMVLVDASHPAIFDQIPGLRQSMRHLASARRVVTSPGAVSHFQEKDRNAALVLMAQPKARYTQLQEYRNFETNALRVADLKRHLSIPVTVVSRGSSAPHPGFQVLEEAWARLQHDLVGLSDRGHQIIAKEGGHAVHMERPALVAYAIISTLDSTRSSVSDQDAWKIPVFERAALSVVSNETEGSFASLIGEYDYFARPASTRNCRGSVVPHCIWQPYGISKLNVTMR
jgi:pimeloyl-ACP methyl ester carboxylesterase